MMSASRGAGRVVSVAHPIKFNPIKTVLRWVIRAYQKFVSPALPRSCKYYPSCSQYAIDALDRFGVTRGLVLAAWRLLRCNPLSYGGHDPVEAQTLFRPRRPRSGR
ncbi:MAG: membrane protein insertion efficiency factor YidD [Thermoleophilia bacterium]|jgi:putative membrane protein insertion efficiency factor